ncbi:calmodulin-binding transcription activator 1-like, partial [Chiloscyllium plagiosum]|uniref:calmodulin-binding transcription activator 1-like n=1 Tax=Chiloscyllium plagiosum TaxID=36176 RepID=UPI001CB80CE5
SLFPSFANGTGTVGTIPHKCNSTKHRIISPKVDNRLSSYSALTEVQNLSAMDNKVEQEESKADTQDLEAVKLSKTVLQVNGTNEVALSKSLGQGECILDPPASRTNGYCQRELSSVSVASSVPNLTVATVTCSIPQNAVILMTGVGDKPVPLTPSQQLVATSSSSPGLPLSSHSLSLAPVAGSIGLSLVPSTAASLVLSRTVEGRMDTSETLSSSSNTAFNPDSFLNSPKQGQTYGGGRGGQEVNTNPSSSFGTAPAGSIPESRFPSNDLKEEPDFQRDSLEGVTVGGLDFTTTPSSSSSDISVFPQNPGLVPVTRTFPVITDTNLVTSSPGPPAVTENMDCSNVDSRKNYSGIFCSPHPPDSSSLPPPQNPFFVPKEPGLGGVPVLSPTVSKGPKVESASLFPQEGGDSGKEDLPMTDIAEPEVSMDTTSQTSTEMARMERGVGTEQSVKPEAQFGVGMTTEDGAAAPLELQCGPVTDLYTIIQNDLSSSSVSSSNIDLNMDHFEISFDSQFPDLMADIMADGGSNSSSVGPSAGFARYTANPAPVPPTDHPAHTVSAQFPDQSLQISSFPQQQLILATGTDVPFPEVPRTPVHPTQTSASGPAESRQPVAITDFSPEWSYPEGGVKVLITGSWSDGSEQYSCVFDQITVPASLIQSGVLRCYCPAHEAGLVRLHVACENQLISNSVLFEYRARNSMALPSSQIDWLSLDAAEVSLGSANTHSERLQGGSWLPDNFQSTSS